MSLAAESKLVSSMRHVEVSFILSKNSVYHVSLPKIVVKLETMEFSKILT